MATKRRVWTKQEKRNIYDSTGGTCHACHRKIYFTNHGKRGERGAWHIDHRVPLAKGGADTLSNVAPACIGCNHAKGVKHTRSVRAGHGVKGHPPSREARRDQQKANTLGGTAIGATAGGIIGGPPGAILGGLLGMFLGNSKKVG